MFKIVLLNNSRDKILFSQIMLKTQQTNELNKKLSDQIVTIGGWVQSRRDHGKLIFLDIRDQAGLVQAVASQAVSNEVYKTVKQLNNEDVVLITGEVKARPINLINSKIASGEIEIEVKSLKILAKSRHLPLDLNKTDLSVSLVTVLKHRSLALRHQKTRAIFKVQEQIVKSFREGLADLGFTEIFVPTIVPTATEGGAEVFEVKYYDKKAYLAQSPQLYKQIMVSVFEKVFTVAHAYRAEPSVTTRHLSEYISLDAEMGFVADFQDIMAIVAEVIKKIFSDLNSYCQAELGMFSNSTPQISENIPIIKLSQAQEIIFKRTKRDHRKELDLDPEDEKEICRWAKEEKGSELIFITHYPVPKRPFYTFPDPEDSKLTLSFDLLGRGLEWVTGGQRINDYNQLVTNIKKWGNKPENFKVYLEAFKYGLPPEGGFALGLERITMQILGLKNIREASLFPRDMERVDIKLVKN